MSDDLVAHFRTRYTEEALRSTQNPDYCRLRPGSTAWNEEIARPLIDSDPPAAETLYSWAIQEARRVEGQTGMRLKKGIEYCNLGVAQLRQSRIRDAYRSFELAEIEDHTFSDASHAGINVLEGMLLLPAGDRLVALVDDLVVAEHLNPSLVRQARELWVRIGREHRLRLREVLPDGLLVSGETDSQRRGRLAVWDAIASVTEDILRLKYSATLPGADQQALLRREFGNGEPNTLFHTFVPTHGKVDPANMDTQVRAVLSSPIDPLTRSMILFYVVRNYTSHYVGASLDTLRNDGEFELVTQYLAVFLSRIGVPAPATGALSYARLPVGISELPFAATTPVSPDLSIVEDWAAQVIVKITGMAPTRVTARMEDDRITLEAVLPTSPSARDELLQYLTAGLTIGDAFEVVVTVTP